jgi:predicted DCC family thiol-disulfide oxidoreductase YuxK
MQNSTIIYDDNCPLCKAYTKAFVKYNFLNGGTRLAFSSVEEQEFIKLVDWKRAKNEIPLIDEKTKTVAYGVDALLIILGNRWKFFKVFAKSNLLVFLSKKLYSFISYNRKIIVPEKPNTECKYNSIADFNVKYRSIYILFCWFICSLILTSYANLLTEYIGKSNLGREFIICGGQIVFQSIVLSLFKTKKEDTFEYIGNMMTVSLIGSLLLIPILILFSFTKFSSL